MIHVPVPGTHFCSRTSHAVLLWIAAVLLLAVLAACSSGGGGGSDINSVQPLAPEGRNYTGETVPWSGTGDPFADDTSKMVSITSAFTVTQASYTLTGTAADGVTGLSLAQGEQASSVVLLSSGSFTVPLTLAPGGNTLHLIATDATGTHPRYNPVIVYDTSGQTGGASSAQLIAAAKAAGSITPEQALSYRIYAAFGDARLPAQYRGDDSLADYENVLSELTSTLPSLSEAAKDDLGPFLAPDIYSDVTASSPKPVFRSANAPTMICNPLRSTDCVVSNTWVSVPGNTMRVWYDAMRSGDRDKALAVLAALDGPAAAWGKLQKIMQVIPIPDMGRAALYGIDDKLDILLTNIENPGITTPSVTDSNNHVPVFIRLKRSLATDQLVGAAVHELMHAFQFALQLANSGGPTAYHTFSEGTADWAVWHVMPKNSFPNQHNYAYFQEPKRKLTSVKDPDTDRFPYATWMFFMYLTKKYGDNTIGDIWTQATSNTDQVNILKTVVSGKGKQLDEVWHDWAISFWNGGPKQEEQRHDLADWAAIKDSPVPASDESFLPSGVVDTEWTFDTADLPALAMEYHRFSFMNADARTLLLLDGWSNVLGKETPLKTPTMKALEAYAVYTPQNPGMVQGARMQVTYRKNGTSKTENFTNYLLGSGAANMWHYQTICRDMADQRIDSMVVTLTYADVSAPGKTYNPPGLSPRLQISNIFCGKVRGSGNLTKTWDGVTQAISLSQFDYLGQDYGSLSLTQPGKGFVIYGKQFVLQSGTVDSWLISGTNSSGCSFSGSWSGTVTGMDFFTTYTFSTDFARRAYQLPGIGASSMQKTSVNVTCPKSGGGTETHPVDFYPLKEFGFKQFEYPSTLGMDTRFTADGTILQGTGAQLVNQGPNSGSWSIRNMPE